MKTNFMQSTHDKLRNYARLRAPLDFEDCVQDVYVRLLENGMTDWSKPVLFKTLGWVLGDLYRKARRAEPLDGADGLASYPSIDDAILIGELLGAEPCAAIVLASAQGFTPAEIAVTMESTPGAISLAKHRAVKRLRSRAGLAAKPRRAPRRESRLRPAA